MCKLMTRTLAVHCAPHGPSPAEKSALMALVIETFSSRGLQARKTAILCLTFIRCISLHIFFGFLIHAPPHDPWQSQFGTTEIRFVAAVFRLGVSVFPCFGACGI